MIQITRKQAAEGFWLGCCSDYYIDPELFKSLRYYFENKFDNSYKELDIADELLEELVCYNISQMPTPIAIPVSGGVDSTFMLLMARKCFETKNLRATVVYSEEKKAEYERAVKLCDEAGICLHAVKVLPKMLGQVIASIDSYSYRNWFYNSSLVPTYFAIKKGAEIGASVLTGDGGDELFQSTNPFPTACFLPRYSSA